MPGEQYKHIFLRNLHETQRYTSPTGGSSKRRVRQDRDRAAHGNFLRERLNQAWRDADERAQEAAIYTEREGAYIEFEGEPGFDLLFKSLEKLGRGDQIRLLNVREEVNEDNGRRTVATVYVPFSQRGYFLRKLDKYLEGNRRGQNLINSIANIRSAVLESFWIREERNQIPGQEPGWVEVWLRDEDGTASGELQRAIERVDIEVSANSLSFPERTVRLAKANRAGLEHMITCSDVVAEMHPAKEVCSFFLDMNNLDQTLFAEDLGQRTRYNGANEVAICILDTGINNGHLLIAPFLAADDMHTVDPGWGTHDHDGHGTLMAGTALYGDLTDLLQNNDVVTIGHLLESAKILPPPPRQNSRDLWGYISAQGVSRAEIRAPGRKRVICMAVTAPDHSSRGNPTSWSAEIDNITSGAEDESRRLMIISSGNIIEEAKWRNYTNSNIVSGVEDPGQSWNALTVGAYTEKIQIQDPTMVGFAPVAPARGLSPFSRTSSTWPTAKWPIKPDVVFEGGNVAVGPTYATTHEDLELLSTHHNPTIAQFAPFNATSASTALAANMAAQIQNAYPNSWPETVRGLLVHSANWTDEMLHQFLPTNVARPVYSQVLRACGYGVPDLDRALYCASNSLTLISEAELQPFDRHPTDSRYVTRDMHLYHLPWPTDILAALGPTNVQMRVTLSYFIQPGPGEVGWKDRYRYPSHGLRFKINGPRESEVDFVRRINALARDEDTDVDTEGPADRWKIGKARNVGSIHSDIWEGSAADLATSHLIAVYPTVGWWRERSHLGKWASRCRYSLIISIRTPEEAADIYIPVAQAVRVTVPVTVRTDRGDQG